MSDGDKELREDHELRGVLRRWEVERPSAGLDERVLREYRGEQSRRSFWLRLMAASIPIPVPVAVAMCALLIIGGYVAGRGSSAPRPRPVRTEPAAATQAASFPVVTATPLAGFQPFAAVRVTVLQKEEKSDE